MKLKAARKKAKLSIKDLANLAEVHHSTIWRIENQRRSPSPQLAIQLENLLHGLITHDELLFPDLAKKQILPNSIFKKVLKALSIK